MNDSNDRRIRRESLSERVRSNPYPAVIWLGAGLALVLPEAGALLSFLLGLVPWGALAGAVPVPGQPTVAEFGRALADVPTLLSRDVIPNQGYKVPGEGWHGTFMGLSPALAWALRAGLVFGYVACWGLWAVHGYRLYRYTYRPAEWTPFDDTVDRFADHGWGLFGLAVVCLFLTFAVFAPAVSPTTAERNIYDRYEQSITHYEDGQLREVSVGTANLDTVSQGIETRNVGVLTYDRYDRFHPFGTLPNGQDLFMFMAAGARVSLFIGLLSIGLSVVLAGGGALVSAYYRGRVDLGLVLAGDSIQAMPQLLVIILLSVVLSGTWIADLYNGGVLIALVFAGTGWPGLWRSIRGPAMQVARESWVEAARGFGEPARVTMYRHILPYVTGYLLVYASMILGGIVIGVAGLSFLGLGVTAPVPEWGRAISAGEPYVDSVSWHIALIPGLLIVLVVTGFNALGDGVRDAIDPQSESSESTVVASSGGGA
ncbi:ABC transporter permease [Halosimplex halophilum]|uniref:ABC transporter permease n=1 Tax=Halosimplex halophilum TaxID=2559572 RepID=UPI00107F88C2|nr:ABC transporter permease [Halosimplex halophilum]